MNKPEFYPYVLLPEEIEKIKIEGIPVPELRDLPEFPEKPKKRFLGTIILIVSIGVMILLGSTHIIKSSFYSNSLTYLAFFISLVSLTATVFEIMHNSKAKKQYRIAVKLYNELKAEREQIKEERRKAIEDNNNQKAIDAYRHSAINTYFKYSYNKIQIGQREYSPAQKRFLIFLEQYFEGKILENARITHELKEIDYAPNFILKLDNPKVNIAIDIEEPYTFDGKKIIVKKNHSEEAYKLRYKVTNELRWICIVFNEEQVVTQPTESCKLIAHAIDEILLKEKYSEQFKNISKIKRAEIPGQRELSAFIRNKYRENYLLAAGLINETDFAASEVEIRKNGSNQPEKIIKTTPEQQTDKEKDKRLNNLKDKKSIIDTNGKSKSIIIEKKEEDNNIEQLEIAKKAAEKFKPDKKETETTQKDIETIQKETKKETEITQKPEEKDTQKSKIIDLDKKKQDAKKELLKSIEAKLKEEKKSSTTKRVSLKKEAEKLNLLYSKSKTDNEKRNEEKERIAKAKEEKERSEKERLKKVKQEKERLVEKEKKAKQIEEQKQSLTEKAKQKRDEIYKERIINEKAEKERLEKERQEKLNAEKERIIKEKEELEKQRIAKEKAEQESKEQKKKEAAEKLKINKQKAEKERLEKERQEKLKIEKEQLIKEKAEKEKLTQEQIAKEKAKKEHLEKKRKEQELAKKIAQEKERIDKMQKELEEKEKIEARNRLMEKYKKQIEVLVSNKQWDMLFDACNEAIKEFPYWEWPYYRRSTMHGNKGNFIDAIEDCNKALSINPKLTDAVYNRATAKFYLQRYEEALDDYQKCIDLNYKNSAEAYFNRGLCFQNLNHPKKAYREFVKAKNLGNIKAVEILNSQY